MTPGRLESQQTELDKTALADTNLVQSLANVKQQIISAFNSALFDENTASSAIDLIITGAISFDDDTIEGSQSNFKNNAGHITVDIKLENINTNDTLSFSLDKDFSKQTSGTINGTGAENADLTVEQALAIIQNINPKIFDETTEINDVLSKIAELLPTRISVEVSNFDNSGEQITFNVKVVDEKTSEAEGEVIYLYKDNTDSGNTGGNGDSENGGAGDTGNNGSENDGTGDTGNNGSGNSGSENGGNNSGENNDSDEEVNSNNKVEIEKSSNEYVDAVAEKIKIYLDGYIPTNESDKGTLNDKFQEILQSTTSEGVTLEINDWNKIDSSSDKKGVLQFVVEVFNDLGDKAKVSFDKFIEKLTGSTENGGNGSSSNDGNNNVGNGTSGNGGNSNGGNGSSGDNSNNSSNGSGGNTSNNNNDNGNTNTNKGEGNGNDATDEEDKSDFEKAVSEVRSYLNKLDAKNSIKKSKVSSKIEDICDEYGVDFSINDWDLEESTKSKKGNLYFEVELTKGDNSKTLEYDEDISKKSSSSSSSSSSDDDDDDDNETNDNSNSTIAGGTSSSDIGNVGKPSTSTDSNGNKVTVSEVTNSNGKYTGSKVKTSGSGNLSIDAKEGNIVAVYKYEPIIGKYIKLPDGLVMNGSNVQFYAEADVYYFVATQLLPENLVLTEGWNTTEKGTYLLNGLNLVSGWKQLNGQWFYMEEGTKDRVENNWKQLNGKWYYLGANGVMQTGWLLDRGNWYYLNPWSGDMATGWKQVGNKWYYLHAYNGAMQAGWHKIGYHWYYMHQDGHMASSEYINGYYLDSEGRWV